MNRILLDNQNIEKSKSKELYRREHIPYLMNIPIDMSINKNKITLYLSIAPKKANANQIGIIFLINKICFLAELNVI